MKIPWTASLVLACAVWRAGRPRRGRGGVRALERVAAHGRGLAVRLKHEDLRARLSALAARHPGLFSITEEGVSSEGRKIPLLVAGSGPTTVLLWSQMHGDEPTATSALLDVLEHLGRTRRTPETERLLSRLTLAIIPMLNPDGAARTRRTNAQGIDVNRDALRLQTPEGRFLKSVRDRLKPSIGYNLHNHSPNVTAGKSGKQVAISLLSVPFDDAFTVERGAPDDHADGRPRPAASRAVGEGSRGPLRHGLHRARLRRLDDALGHGDAPHRVGRVLRARRGGRARAPQFRRAARHASRARRRLARGRGRQGV